MAAVNDNVSNDVRSAIEGVLHESLAAYGYRKATVRADVDHDGDPVLRVTAHFDLVPEPIETSITFEIIGKVREALAEIGETRFPHVRYDFHDDQRILSTRKRRRA